MNPRANTDLLGIEQETLKAGSHLMFPLLSFSHLSSPCLQSFSLLFTQSAGASSQCGFPASWDGLRRRKDTKQGFRETLHWKENYLKGHKQLPTIRTAPLVSAATSTAHFFMCKLHLEKKLQCPENKPRHWVTVLHINHCSPGLFLAFDNKSTPKQFMVWEWAHAQTIPRRQSASSPSIFGGKESLQREQTNLCYAALVL